MRSRACIIHIESAGGIYEHMNNIHIYMYIHVQQFMLVCACMWAFVASLAFADNNPPMYHQLLLEGHFLMRGRVATLLAATTNTGAASHYAADTEQLNRLRPLLDESYSALAVHEQVFAHITLVSNELHKRACSFPSSILSERYSLRAP